MLYCTFRAHWKNKQLLFLSTKAVEARHVRVWLNHVIPQRPGTTYKFFLGTCWSRFSCYGTYRSIFLCVPCLVIAHADRKFHTCFSENNTMHEKSTHFSEVIGVFFFLNNWKIWIPNRSYCYILNWRKKIPHTKWINSVR